MVFGQIKAKGKVQTEELLQFAELGLPAFAILRKELGLTRDELSQKLQAGELESGPAIKALRKGLDKQFGGMAKAQSKTFAGQLSTMKDEVNQILGDLTLPLFEKLRDDVFPWVNKNLPGLKGVFESVKGAVVDGFGRGKELVGDFLAAIEPAKPLWDNVLGPLLKGLAVGIAASVVGTLKVAIPTFKLFMKGLGLVGKLAAPLKPIFFGIGAAIGFVFSGPILLKAASLLKGIGGLFKALGVVVKALAIPVRVLGLAFGFVFSRVFRVYAFVGGKLFGLFGKLPGVLGRAASGFAAFAGRAWSAVKGGIDKVLGFLGGLGDKFMSAGQRLWTWLVGGLKKGIGAGIGFAGDLGKLVANAVIGFLNDAIPDKIPVPGAPDIGLPANPIPMLASGGTVTAAGSVLVGEQGPEILRLGKGARVDPLPKRGPLAAMSGDGRPIVLHNVVELDGEVVARNTARHVRDARNRQ